MMKSRMKKATKKPVKKKVSNLFVNFVLDETGSMLSCEQATISGFNEYAQTLKAKAKNVLFSLLKFNSTKMEATYCGVPISKVAPLTNVSYRPQGLTPLYDAIAHSIKGAETAAQAKDVLCVIMTDGEENASHELSREKLLDLIQRKEKQGWTFVYLGANQDSWAVGQSIGLKRGNVINFGTAKVGETMSYMASNTVAYAASDTKTRRMSAEKILVDRDNSERKLSN